MYQQGLNLQFTDKIISIQFLKRNIYLRPTNSELIRSIKNTWELSSLLNDSQEIDITLSKQIDAKRCHVFMNKWFEFTKKRLIKITWMRCCRYSIYEEAELYMLNAELIGLSQVFLINSFTRYDYPKSLLTGCG